MKRQSSAVDLVERATYQCCRNGRWRRTAHLFIVFLALGVFAMQHDVTFYTKRGFDYKTAKYFASGRRRATAVKPLPDKALLVTFDSGEMRFYDMTPLICPGTVFVFLADEGAFERAYIDENHTTWLGILTLRSTVRLFGTTRWTSVPTLAI